MLSVVLRSGWVRVQVSFLTRSSSLSRRRVDEADLDEILVPWSDTDLDDLDRSAQTAIENEGVAFQALDAYREGSADFSDYLLALSIRAAGCETTYSFDRLLCAHPMVTAPR